MFWNIVFNSLIYEINDINKNILKCMQLDYIIFILQIWCFFKFTQKVKEIGWNTESTVLAVWCEELPQEGADRFKPKSYGKIFSGQASLTRQAFLITALHGARYKMGKNAYAKKVVLCNHM